MMISNQEMIRELTGTELESIVGGFSVTFAALNPQPIPPGRIDYLSFLHHLGPTPSPPPGFPRNPGDPGPF